MSRRWSHYAYVLVVTIVEEIVCLKFCISNQISWWVVTIFSKAQFYHSFKTLRTPITSSKAWLIFGYPGPLQLIKGFKIQRKYYWYYHANVKEVTVLELRLALADFISIKMNVPKNRSFSTCSIERVHSWRAS